MILDKRITDSNHIFNALNANNAEKYIGQSGFFANCAFQFHDLSECEHAILHHIRDTTNEFVSDNLDGDEFEYFVPDVLLMHTKITKLEDTVLLMQSSSYIDRFIAEYFQLKIRIEKLADFIRKYELGSLNFKPKCSLAILNDQLEDMREYLSTLDKRANIEGILIAKD